MCVCVCVCVCLSMYTYTSVYLRVSACARCVYSLCVYSVCVLCVCIQTYAVGEPVFVFCMSETGAVKDLLFTGCMSVCVRARVCACVLGVCVNPSLREL